MAAIADLVLGGGSGRWSRLLAEACGTWLRRCELLAEVFTTITTPLIGHHYLAFLGVRPGPHRAPPPRPSIELVRRIEIVPTLDDRGVPGGFSSTAGTAAAKP